MIKAHRHPEQQPNVRRDDDDKGEDPFQRDGEHGDIW